MALIGGSPYREEVQDPNARSVPRVGPIQQVNAAPGRILLDRPEPSGATEFVRGVTEIANKVLPEKINEAIAKQQAEGYVAAAQGKTAFEVEKDQPWYTRLFGRSAAGTGALNYEAEAATQDYLANAMAGMGEDRKMTPEEYRKVLAERAGAVATGDPEIDSIVQSKLITASQQLGSTHMKEHIAYTQERASAARQSSFLSAAEAADRMKDSKDTEAYGNQVQVFSNLLQAGPVEGETEESFHRSVALAVESGLVADNPFMYEALATSGKIVDLPEDNQVRINAALQGYKERAAAKADASTVSRMANVFSMVGKVDAKTLGMAMLDLNAEQEARGGKPVWDAEGMARVLASSQDQFAKLQAVQAQAALAQGQDRTLDTLAVSTAISGAAYQAYLAAGGKEMPNETKQALMTQYRTDPAFRKYMDSHLGENAELKMLSNLQYVDPGISAALQASFLPNIGKRWEDAGGGAGFAVQLDKMEQLAKENPSLAQKTFGDPLLQSRWNDYLALRNINMQYDQAYNQTFAAPAANPEIRLDYRELNKSVKTWESDNEVKLSPVARAVLTNQSNSAYAKYGEQAFSVLANNAKANASTLWGYMVPAVDEVSLNSQLGNLDDESLEELLDLSAATKLLDADKAGGTTLNDIEGYVTNRISRNVITMTPVIDGLPQDDLSVTTTIQELQELRTKELDSSISRIIQKRREQGLGDQGDLYRNFGAQ